MQPAIEVTLRLAGQSMVPDFSGALFWPAAATLIVADLHLEKGSHFAGRGSPLPPYDTRATLARLADTLRRMRPSRVVCLGDSFHDGAAARRLDPIDRDALASMAAGHEWLWVAGNHDPKPAALGGRIVDEVAIGPLVFRHQAEPGPITGEISGHFHPKAGLRARGRRLTGRCFVGDGRRLILPAFGAYAGGLDVLDPGISGLFPDGFEVHLIGRERVVALPRERLAPIGA